MKQSKPQPTPQQKQQTVIEVTKDELPMHCPAPNADLWDSHPRVFIPLEDTPEASCSYCGNVYRLVDQKSVAGAKK